MCVYLWTVAAACDIRRSYDSERTTVSSGSPTPPDGVEPTGAGASDDISSNAAPDPTGTAGTPESGAPGADPNIANADGAAGAESAEGAAAENATATRTGGAHYAPSHAASGSTEAKNPWMWIAIGAVVVAIIGGVIWFMSSSNKTPEPTPSPTVTAISVPSVVGFTVEKATESLQSAGLVVGAITTKPSDKETGLILEQNPTSGTQVTEGTTVTLVVAGDANPKVPDIVGMNQTDAVNALIAAGLSQGTINKKNSPEAPGTVLAQDPPAGQGVKKGTAVNFTVATGTLAVPDVTGKSEAEATAALRNAGLDVTTQTREVSEGPIGVVIEQSPKAGEQVSTGTSIVITISAAKPSPTPTPKPEPSPSPTQS